MHITSIFGRHGMRVLRTRLSALVALTVALAACNGVLDVQNQQDILDTNLDNPNAIGPLLAGVAGDFSAAYSNSVNIVGLFGGELIHTGSFPSWEEVQGGVGTRPSTEGSNMYNTVERAMWVADTAAVRLGKLVSNPGASPEIASAMIWGAFASFILADNYCQGTIKAGPAVAPDSLYKRAEALFSQALQLATAAGKDSLRFRALAGRARARLMLKNYAGARDDATLIPGTFIYNAIYSSNSTREYNSVASNTTTLIRREAGVHPRFYNDARYKTDSRTPFLDRGDTAKGPDPTRKFVEQLKYPVYGTPIPVATWQEERLIEAEAEARLGNTARAVVLINQVRTAARLAAYAGGAPAEVLNQIQYERSAELWLQAQSLSDLRRFQDPFLATRRDQCFQIGQTEWDTNPNLGAGH